MHLTRTSKKLNACIPIQIICVLKIAGQVEGNVVFTYLDAFDTNKEELEELKAHYRPWRFGRWYGEKRLEGIFERTDWPYS